MLLRHLALAGFVIASNAVHAQQPAPPGMSLSQAAARRFPQPVLIGVLLNRQVLQPLESQPVLGRVQTVVKRTDGTIDIVVAYGGIFGLFSRPIAVPVDAMVLLGKYMEIVDYTPDQLSHFETFDRASAMPLPSDSIIHVGLARPSH